MSQPVSATVTTRWLAILFDCLGQSPRSPALPRQGVEREMHIHEQPHLVPPMKLVFYDEMPQSPLYSPSHRVSQWVSHGRDLASRASDRTSFGVRRKMSKQSISGPVIVHASDLPLRNGSEYASHLRPEPKYRPLELSIYLPGNRLSDLPEFTAADFSDSGLIQLPPRALLRARSDNSLNSAAPAQPRPSMSMISERQLEYWQRRRASSATSRPGSACEGLSSHPVSNAWDSLPGLPAKPALSPMVEEFEPMPSPLPRKDDLSALDFPPIEEEASSPQSPGFTLPTAPVNPALAPYQPHTRLNSFKRTRVSQWLSRSSSTDTTNPTISASIPANTNTQFYQCTVSAGSPRSTASPALSTPRPLPTTTTATSPPQPHHAPPSPPSAQPNFEFRFSRIWPQPTTTTTTTITKTSTTPHTTTTTHPIPPTATHKPTPSTSSTTSTGTAFSLSSSVPSLSTSMHSKTDTHVTSPSMTVRSRAGTLGVMGEKGEKGANGRGVPDVPELSMDGGLVGMGVAF